MGTKIITVRGPIEPEQLGFTSMHEHILVDASIFRDRAVQFIPEDSPVSAGDPVSLENLVHIRHLFFITYDNVRVTDVDLMTKEVARFKKAGGGAILDVSPVGARHDLLGIRKISEATDVNIITSTGVYSFDSWPDEYKEMELADFTRFMLNEIKDGIGDTGVYPGNIKVALDIADNPKELIAVRAGARVAAETGYPITVHQGEFITEDQADTIVRIAKEEGVDLTRLTIAHASKHFVEKNLDQLILNPNSWGLRLDHIKQWLDQGVNISVDLFGFLWDAEAIGRINPTDWQQLAGIVALVNEGYAGQIVIGTDTFMKSQTSSYGGDGYCRLTDFVVPMLRKLEIPESAINSITVENPRRILSV